MDIKSIRNLINSNITTTQVDIEKKTQLRSGESAERDANGQMLGQGRQDHREFSDEEREKILTQVRSLNGVKDNNLVVRLQRMNEKHFVIIEDSKGKMIRRMNIQDLAHLLVDNDKGKGHILNKAL